MSDPSSPPPLRPPSYSAPAPGDPPRQRGVSWKRALAICAGVVVLALVALVGLGLWERRELRRELDALPTYGYTESPELASAKAGIKARDDRTARIGQVISDAMAGQSAALLGGDKATFVGYAAPGYRLGQTWLTRSFTSLRAMGVAQWTPKVDSWTPYSGTRWQSTIDVSYCFVAGCATPSTITLHTMWDLADEAHPRMTELWEYTGGQATPPWAQTVLQAKVGSRVIVAGPAATAGRFGAVLAEAEKAAKVADRYALTTTPSKYVVYLAGAKEWGRWPYGEEGDWVAGYAEPERESVVLRASSATPSFLPELLRHEMGHVSTLAGQGSKVKYADAWWLVEGMADYVAAEERPFAQYSDRPVTISFVRGKWNGDLRVGAPKKKASPADANGRYGTAYLGVSCLVQQYGRARALGFFHAVAVVGSPLTTAATEQLGVPWTTVSSTCTAQIRRTAH
ncbi:hypothetical protein [Paractinoplanes durhamensis]|uniref:Uncharacterized protein n=1 Tax=Paractinoplanes durhamensis TaxID=113563 RepID=A0ABQ3YVD9_9ACTN|nr:hypothetical protein [Actinoplanes durhamensis]GIE01534.1 hypothetical protein Adu01nite_28840 [Actinoplanes durhamensis]